MKFKLLVFLAAFLSVATPLPAQQPEHTIKLGHGYQLLTFAEDGGSSFEAVGHFQYLYHGRQRLCDANIYSISPTGAYAAYFDDSTRNIELFCAADSKSTILAAKAEKAPASFEWNEKEGWLLVHFKDGAAALKIALK